MTGSVQSFQGEIFVDLTVTFSAVSPLIMPIFRPSVTLSIELEVIHKIPVNMPMQSIFSNIKIMTIE